MTLKPIMIVYAWTNFVGIIQPECPFTCVIPANILRSSPLSDQNNCTETQTHRDAA